MSVLNKTLGELSEKEVESLKKRLGVKGRPYPMKDTTFVEDNKGEKILVQHLGVLESNKNPLTIYSEREYAQVLGMAMREMPTPSMLPLFFDAVNRRRPGSKRVVQFLKGAAGAGKTYMSELIGRMRSEKGPMVVNCGDKNLSELLYETVLDFNTDRRFYDELDKRLQNGALNPVSLKILKGCLGEAYSEEKGRVSIDWNVVGHDVHDKDDGSLETSKEAVSNALKGLEEVRKLEGLEHLGGNTLGMATQEGPLIVAWKQGREIVLDEYNKSKEGTDGSLQGVLQFLAGEIDEHTVENTLKEKGDQHKQTFAFRREDQKVGFFVTLTGNAEEDGSTTRELSQSVHSRVHPQFIPLATVEDWQHRICQMLTGLPVSTIYRSGEAQWAKDPDGFRRKLLEWRTIGLSANEKKNIPDIQIRMLQRWEDLMDASEKLARFYYGWSQIVNPDSPTHRAGTLAQLMEEIDERYNSEVSIDFRKILDHIKEAMEMRPEVKSIEDSEGYDTGAWDAPPVMSEKEVYEDPATRFGERLVRVILNHINKTTIEIGKTNLHRQLMQHAADCGLSEPALHEGFASKRKNVAALLDDNPYASDVLDVRARLVRDLMCDYLREVHPSIVVDNDEIMSTQMVRKVLEGLEGEENQQKLAGKTNKLIVFNENLNDILRQPLRDVEGIDATPENGQSEVRKFAAKELLSGNALLATLAAPALRKHNLAALWDKALSRSGVIADGQSKVVDQGLAIAQGESNLGLAMTTLMLKDSANDNKARAVPYHIVWNKKTDHVLIVGEGEISERLQQAYANSNTTYVNKLEASAEKKIRSGLAALMGADAEKSVSILKNAFLMRNMLDSLEDEEKASLESLMVRKDVNTYLPHYIKNGVAGPKPNAA